MKRIGSFTINLAIAAALLATGGARQARAGNNCSKATLKGSYGALLTGTIPGVGPFVTVAVANFDGVGGWSYTETGNVNGNVFSGQHFVGAYTVASDCSGSTSDSGGNKTALVIVNGGKEVMGVGTGGAVFSIVLKKISGSDD
jgi:hypothetical protein